MFAKVFQSIYEGTLADNWQALVTFQQMLILANADGVVDMTAVSISRRTGIPLEIIAAGIARLEEADPQSRTPDLDGRRIARLDPHREWGWFIVNHLKYRAMVSKDDKRAADRERINSKREEEKQAKTITSQPVAKCRELSPPVASCSEVSLKVADVAHTDTDLEAKSKEKETPIPPAGATPGQLTLVPSSAKPASRRRGAVTLRTYLDECERNDVDAVSADDPVFAYAARIGLPEEFLALAWSVFEAKYRDTDRKQTRWPQKFRNAVEGNWFRLWYQGEGGWVLTTAGIQAQRAYTEAKAA